MDRANLTDDLVIGTGGWHTAYARVILIVADEDNAFVIVDGNGDGSELEMEYWHKAAIGWVGGQSSGYGHLDNVRTAIWDAGPMVCAVGSCAPGDAALIRHDGENYECPANQFGIWGFVQKNEVQFMGRLPEVVGVRTVRSSGAPATRAEARPPADLS
jgi:hypothetical protein